MSDETPTFSYYRGAKEPSFATRTELEAAKLFDYHRIAWEYEPRTFILEQDERGNIVEAFTPDFFLPDLDLFVEVTEMKQSLVTAKNRKVRKLREMYPDVRIKLLYRKDFVRMAQKYDLWGTMDAGPLPQPSTSTRNIPTSGSGKSSSLDESPSACASWAPRSRGTIGTKGSSSSPS